MNRGTKASLTVMVILVFALPVVLAGCAGPEEKKNQPSGSKARDLYDEMLDEEQEDLEKLDELPDD